MTIRSTRVAVLVAVLSACDVFDPKLYQEAGDGGTGEDAGEELPLLALADRCTGGNVPVVESSHDPQVVSTDGLTDTFDVDIAACTGSQEPGADGFFQVQAEAGDKWHFHLKIRDPDANPALYVMRSCDERACSAASALDECGGGRDEHLSFRAPATGTYFVGIDSSQEGGATYELVAVHPVCGNGGQPEHSETCDDGNTDDGDGCSSDCRAEVGTSSPAEVEPNDESTNANTVVLGADGHADVQGSLGGRCDFDMWEIVVADGDSLRVTMLDANGNRCQPGATAFRMQMFTSDGRTVAGNGADTEDNVCPSIEHSMPFAQGMQAGPHFVRVTTVNDEPEAVGYRLAVELTH